MRARYDALFEACPGAFVQQSSYWAELIGELGPDKPILLLCEENGRDLAGLPLYLYPHRLGNILTSVPQPGPLGGVFLRPGLPAADADAAYAALLRRALEIARENECLTLTIISDPFRADLELYQRHLEPEYLFLNFTQYVPLDEVVSGGRLVLEDLERRSNLSRNLRKAHAAGLRVEACRDEGELLEWHALHRERHLAVGAQPLELSLFQAIRRRLEPRDKARLFLAKAGDEIAAGCLYVYHREVLDVFMLSMSEGHADAGPNFLLTEHSLLWAAGRGARIYNWQSSPSRESGVYRYKKQWGSREAPYAFVTRRLCDAGRLAAIGKDGVRSAYPWHYVVPFAAFDEGFGPRVFAK